MTDRSDRLRVALVAGTLAQGGAEKQLIYLVSALRSAGAEVRVYSLTRGEFHEPELRAMGMDPVWVGRRGNPAMRIAALALALRGFRPHIVQATHFYVNLYVRAVAPMYDAIGIGAVRNDVDHEVRANGRWGPWLLRAPSALIMNSHAARENAIDLGLPATRLHVLPNAIDLRAFDDRSSATPAVSRSEREPNVVSVGTLATRKRFDRFLHALALARSKGARLRGTLVGDGPERGALEALASELGLSPPVLTFAGRRNDVPAILRSADIYLLTSEHEGFPNVLLEAMASRLPVVTTPAGDAAVIVREGVTGFVVQQNGVEMMAARLTELADSAQLRRSLGEAGRARVGCTYTCDVLPARVGAVHRAIAEQLGHRRTLKVLNGA